MRKSAYGRMTLEELLSIYAAAASLHGSSSNRGDYRITNRQARILIDTYCELRLRGKEAQQSLLGLLSHGDRAVRCWAAFNALEFAPEVGLPILEELATDPGLVGLDARMVLQEWSKGTLKFP